LEPEILIIDEVLAVGDLAFQKKCLGKMGEVAKSGRTVLFVSHHMPSILGLCPTAILLEAGQIAFGGPSSTAIREIHEFKHPKRCGKVLARGGSTKHLRTFSSDRPESLQQSWSGHGSYSFLSTVLH
jgi:lipopolysaccharide transport system ATP-binding protein